MLLAELEIVSTQVELNDLLLAEYHLVLDLVHEHVGQLLRDRRLLDFLDGGRLLLPLPPPLLGFLDVFNHVQDWLGHVHGLYWEDLIRRLHFGDLLPLRVLLLQELLVLLGVLVQLHVE